MNMHVCLPRGLEFIKFIEDETVQFINTKQRL